MENSLSQNDHHIMISATENQGKVGGLSNVKNDFECYFENQSRVHSQSYSPDARTTETEEKKWPHEDLNTTYMDPVHGHIDLPKYLVRIINTRQFQRLRNLLQLGVSFNVFPTATHKRFEHCIGTAYLALKVAKKLKKT